MYSMSYTPQISDVVKSVVTKRKKMQIVLEDDHRKTNELNLYLFYEEVQTDNIREVNFLRIECPDAAGDTYFPMEGRESSEEILDSIKGIVSDCGKLLFLHLSKEEIRSISQMVLSTVLFIKYNNVD